MQNIQSRITGVDQIRYFGNNKPEVSITRKSLSVPTILTVDFMRKYTNFWSTEEMEEEFQSQFGASLTNAVLETTIFNKFIRDNTIFEGWRDMLTKAGEMNVSRMVRRAIQI